MARVQTRVATRSRQNRRSCRKETTVGSGRLAPLHWTRNLKNDEYIKEIVAASIRRHGHDMAKWVGTRLWDQGDCQLKTKLSAACDLDSVEQPILYSYIDSANWTLVTTRRIWCAVDQRVKPVAASDVIGRDLGNFKGYGQQSSERMQLRCRNGEACYCPFETGNPSMGTIYAIQTLCQVI